MNKMFYLISNFNLCGEPVEPLYSSKNVLFK